MGFWSDVGSGLSKAASIVDDVIPDAGDIVESACDKVGLPKQWGDIAAVATNCYTGDYNAAIIDGIDLADGIGKSKADEPRAAEEPAEPSAPELDLSDRRAHRVSKETGDSAFDFKTMSDEELMRRIREGTIPKDIAQDPLAMLALQTRMQEIQQMNALMTNLMRAMHEMQIEIIRNIRA